MHKSIHKPCLWALLADAGTKTRSGNTTDNRYNWFIEARLIVVVSMKGTSRSTCYQTGFGESIIGGGKPISDLLTSGLQSAHRHYHLDVHLIWTFESPLIIRRWHCVVDLSTYIHPSSGIMTKDLSSRNITRFVRYIDCISRIRPQIRWWKCQENRYWEYQFPIGDRTQVHRFLLQPDLLSQMNNSCFVQFHLSLRNPQDISESVVSFSWLDVKSISDLLGWL